MAKQDLIDEAKEKGLELSGSETVKDLTELLASGKKDEEAIITDVKEEASELKEKAESEIKKEESKVKDYSKDILSETKENYQKLKEFYKDSNKLTDLKRLISSHKHLED